MGTPALIMDLHPARDIPVIADHRRTECCERDLMRDH